MQNLSPLNTNRVEKTFRFFGEVVVAGAIATGFWVLGERSISHGNRMLGGCLNFVAVCLYFATTPIAALKVWNAPKRIWGLYGMLCIVVLMFFVRSAEEESHATDFIPNTRVTYRRLGQIYPFGYAIYFANGDKTIFESSSFQGFHWNIDWDLVKIFPDFAENTWRFTIPRFSASGPVAPTPGAVIAEFNNDGILSSSMEMVLGRSYNVPLPIAMKNEPEMNAAIIGDDQRNPVFVLGFRINTRPQPPTGAAATYPTN